MNTKEIQLFLKQIHQKLEFNVFAANEIPMHFTWPVYLIANLDPNTKPGSHWVAIHIDISGVGEYFDSFGQKPTGYHEYFLKTNCKKWFYNNKVLQNYFSSVCGIYCLVYMYFRFKGISMFNFITIFSEDTFCNDIIVKEMFKSVFY